MIDPLVGFLMPAEDQATQNDISHYIQVEEAIDCRNSNRRFFSLLNKESALNIIISEQSTIISCKLDRHEIVVERNLYNETHETWAIGDRPYQKLANLLWNSHVRGSELVLSSSSSLASGNNPIANVNNGGGAAAANSNPHTTLYYELTRSNQLNCMGKLKSIHMQHQVFYFNLNRAAQERTPIDGHRLAVKCNGSLAQIQMQPTKLLCACNKSSPATSRLAQSLVSDIPCELVQRAGAPETAGIFVTPDDLILCDAIYSLESTSPLDYLQAQLHFHDRSLVFEVRSLKASTSSANASTSGGGGGNGNGGGPSSSHGNVTSSTNRSKSRVNVDLMQQQVTIGGLQLSGPSNETPPSQVDDSIATSSSPTLGQQQQVPTVKLESRDCAAPPGAATSSTGSEIKYKFANNNAKQAASSSQHPSTMLRLRIRATNFGVCILPHMMTNYTCSYKFAW